MNPMTQGIPLLAVIGPAVPLCNRQASGAPRPATLVGPNPAITRPTILIVARQGRTATVRCIMDTLAQIKSIGAEFNALRDRVRNIIGSAHWGQDGAWKESILRAVLSRYVPESLALANGFVVGPNDTLSTQIDLMLCDKERPSLFRDSDFRIVTPESVAGINEVKTTFRMSEFRKELKKASENIALIRQDGRRQSEGRVFCGVLYYAAPSEVDLQSVLKVIAEVCATPESKVDFIAIGPDILIKYFGYHPLGAPSEGYNSWRAYRLPDQSFGYFIMSIIECTSLNSMVTYQKWWWPTEGKEFGYNNDAKAVFTGRVF